MPKLADYGIDKLSRDERYELLLELEESLEAEEPTAAGSTLTPAKRAELDRRLAEHKADPSDVIPWEQIKAEALARFGK